ncbi:MAG: polyprenyl synthetase family protein [Polyangiaceae bacterium]|nr:polyprenyl synthetase family protein [Polyangiaceae bacterium]
MSTALALQHEPPLVDLLDEQFGKQALAELLDLPPNQVPWELWADALHGPLRDLLSRPGKEFRARLVDAAWRLAGQHAAPPRELTLLVEALHAGSLIIDDIQDGSAYRRGAPALHVGYGLPRALNAGNWLYFWSEQLAGRCGLAPHVELAVRRLMTRTLVQCHHGQGLDLTVRVAELPKDAVPGVVRATTQLKTGALMQLAAELGAVAAGARPEVASAIGRFGRELGVGLQMLDDLGGLVSERLCHKGHEDLVLGRPTWAWAWAAERADSLRYRALLAAARKVQAGALHPEALAEQLRAEIAELGTRRVHEHLERAFHELEAVVGSSPALGFVRHEIERLERSHV